MLINIDRADVAFSLDLIRLAEYRAFAEPF